MSLQYSILPGNPAHSPNAQKLYEAAYSRWKEQWIQTFKGNDVEMIPSADHFLRQTYIGLITDEFEKVIAVHLYTMWDLNLETCKEHSYFSNYYGREGMDKLLSMPQRKLISLEALSIHPDWRRGNKGLALGSAMLGLGFHIVEALNFDGAIGIVRTDVKLDNIVKCFGGHAIVKGLNFHNTPCDLMVLPRSGRKDHPDAKINELMQQLWQGRHDYTGVFEAEPLSQAA